MDFQTRYVFDPKNDLLGKGGFSKVYKASDTLLERPVALKFFTAKAADKYQILNEIKKVIRFEHPNLCKYYDVALLTYKSVLGETEQMEVGIMEYIDAGNFRAFTQKHPEYTDKLLIDVLKGLAYLHKHGMAHRDLKPQNILIKMVDDEPVSKITDFGISKLIDTDDAHSSALLGTIEYMAPEQFNPKKYGINSRITTNLDLWSFGLLVYDTICHDSFFGSRSSWMSAEQVMSNILSDASLEKTDALPPKYREIVKRCLIKNAAERVQNAQELIPLFQDEVTSVNNSRSKLQTAVGKGTMHATQVLGPILPINEEETEVMRPGLETIEDETRFIDLAPEVREEETTAAQPILDFSIEETQTIAPVSSTIEIAKAEPISLAVAEDTEVFEPLSETMEEQTVAIEKSREKQVEKETERRQPVENRGDKIWIKAKAQLVRKPILLSAAAVLLIAFFLAYAFLNSSLRPKQEKLAPPVVTLTPKIEVPELINIDGGAFLMGDSNIRVTDPATPAHQVAIDAYSLGKYELTVDQFKEFIDETNYVTTAQKNGFSQIFTNGQWKPGKGVNWQYDVHGNLLDSAAKKMPVVHVSWIDANAYCQWLSKKNSAFYRLPTEAEWEYASRGGRMSQNFLFSGNDNIDQVAWYKENSGNSIHPTGEKQPNELGIYDMSGNVIEWCHDSYTKDYYKNSPQKNPINSYSSGQKVVRGGAWGGSKAYCRNTYRYSFKKDETGGTIGFRICKVNKSLLSE